MSYLQAVLDPDRLVSNADGILNLIKESKIEFDSIAVWGNSGTIISGLVAAMLHKNIIVIRKDNEQSHGYVVEMNRSSEFAETYNVRYIIIDDGVSSGEAVNRIISEMSKDSILLNYHADCVGLFLYNPSVGVPNAYRKSMYGWIFPIYSIPEDDDEIWTNPDEDMTPYPENK